LTPFKECLLVGAINKYVFGITDPVLQKQDISYGGLDAPSLGKAHKILLLCSRIMEQEKLVDIETSSSTENKLLRELLTQ
jgi:hypothetical protein